MNAKLYYRKDGNAYFVELDRKCYGQQNGRLAEVKIDFSKVDDKWNLPIEFDFRSKKGQVLSSEDLMRLQTAAQRYIPLIQSKNKRAIDNQRSMDKAKLMDFVAKEAIHERMVEERSVVAKEMRRALDAEAENAYVFRVQKTTTKKTPTAPPAKPAVKAIPIKQTDTPPKKPLPDLNTYRAQQAAKKAEEIERLNVEGMKYEKNREFARARECYKKSANLGSARG